MVKNKMSKFKHADIIKAYLKYETNGSLYIVLNLCLFVIIDSELCIN